jgi:hypothetical protein
MTSLDTVNSLSLPAAIDTNKFTVLPALFHLICMQDTNDVQPTYEALKRSKRLRCIS